MEKCNYKGYTLVGNCGLMVQLLLLLWHATIAYHHMLKFQQENQSYVTSFIYTFLIVQLIIFIELYKQSRQIFAMCTLGGHTEKRVIL